MTQQSRSARAAAHGDLHGEGLRLSEPDSLEQALLERDQALSALQDLHDRYEALLKAQSEVGECFIISKGPKVLYANDAYCELTGYTSEELLALPDMRVILHPDARAPHSERHARRAQDSPVTDRYETTIVRKDGRAVEIEVAVRGTQIGPDATVFSIIREITEQKRVGERLRESEARYRLLFEHSSDAVLIGYPDVGLLTANPAACQIFGYTPEEFSRLNRAQVVDEKDLPIIAGLFAGNQKSQRRAEITFIRKDGTPFPAEVTFADFVDQHGRFTGGMIIRDITERRLVEQMKAEFITVVSHELRTPLTALRGALGLLSGSRLGGLSAQGERMLSIALGNTDRLMRLVNDILDVERMATGTLRLEIAQVDVATLLDRSAHAMQALADEARVAIEVRPVAARIQADADRIIQALTNLLSNAIKFSSPGGTVSLRADLAGDQLRFAIADRGRGIPAEMLEAIFERFRQVDASDCRARGGTGLGLPISRSIVEQHGGRIWAESRPGEGSTFYFTLPTIPAGDIAP